LVPPAISSQFLLFRLDHFPQRLLYELLSDSLALPLTSCSPPSPAIPWYTSVVLQIADSARRRTNTTPTSANYSIVQPHHPAVHQSTSPQIAPSAPPCVDPIDHTLVPFSPSLPLFSPPPTRNSPIPQTNLPPPPPPHHTHHTHHTTQTTPCPPN
jgi:hypothetical protein